MKTQYKKIIPTWEFNFHTGEPYLSKWGAGRYDLRYRFWYRNPKTTNERRQNSAAQNDGHKVRGKRREKHLPTSWDDKRFSRIWGRSWKDYTKQRKQWG